MRIVPVPCLTDNYAYLVIASGGEAAVVDASEAAPVREALRREGARLTAIWSTHHHLDHVGGNAELAAEAKDTKIDVIAHASDRGRVPAQTRGVDTGDTVRVGDLEARCIHIPGHTLGAVAYVIEAGAEGVVFTGDTLFCAGCGRIFEGTPAQMQASLERLAALSGSTRVYCGHEYTANNLRFAAHVEPGNEAIGIAQERTAALRARGEPSVGTTIDEERAVNPFLRSGSPQIRAALGIPKDADEVAAFAVVRAAKDSFR
jgi:hydroxyacylglutathione hydrolase